MGKKAFIAAVIVLALSMSLVAGMQTVKMAMANPYWPPPFYPPSPVKDPAVIVIQNPVNGTFCRGDQVQVNFTVTQPGSWFQDGLTVGSINDIYCQIDGGTAGTFNVLALNPVPKLLNPQPFSIDLNVTEGPHTLTVMVNALTFYDTHQNVNWHLFSSFSVDATQTVTFTVAKDLETTPSPTFFPNATSLLSPSPSPVESPTQQPTAEPSQTPDRPQVEDFAPVIIAGSMIFLAIIAVGLLVYFGKKRG